MSKSNTNKGKQNPPQKVTKRERERTVKPLVSNEETHRRNIRLYGLIIAIIGFAIYMQSVNYGFTLDDRTVIVENKITTQGISALGTIFTTPYMYGSVLPDDKIYRPISKAIFALCWTLSPGKPFLMHLFNVLFYALTGFFLFVTLAKYMTNNLAVPFMASLFYIVHPLHTEVVDSIKSMDEICTFLFFILSLNFVATYLKNKSMMSLMIAAICFMVSFLSKESGVALVVVFPLLLYFVKTKPSEIVKVTAVMVLMTLIVFGIRTAIVHLAGTNPISPGDNILLNADSFLTREATAIYLAGLYLKLLIFPHPLVFDYATKQLELVTLGDWRFLVSLVIYGGALVYAIIRIKQRDWISFAILFFFISFAVTSNVIIFGGTHFAERFMYAPSLGFCIIIAELLHRFINKVTEKGKQTWSLKTLMSSRPMLRNIVIVITLLFAAKTIAQNPVWADNISLFENGIKVSPLSYRTHVALAEDLSKEAYLKQFPKDEQKRILALAANEEKICLSIYNDVIAYNYLGNIYFLQGNIDSALYYFKMGMSFAPNNKDLSFNTALMLNRLKRYDEAIPVLNHIVQIFPDYTEAYYNLALAYTNKGDFDNGLKYFTKVIEMDPKRAEAFYYSGKIVESRGDKERANTFFAKARELGYKF